VLVTTALYWLVARQRPRFGLDREATRSLVGFGLPVTAVTLVAFAIYNVANLIVGIRLGDAELGLFSLAYRLPELIVLNLCIVVSDVVFSAMSRLQDDRAQLTRYYTGVLTGIVAVTAPIGVAMAATAPDIVGLLYGAAFAGSADDLALLALFAVVYSASFHSGDVYKALGRPGILTAINAAKLAIMVVPLWWATAGGTVLVAATLLGVELVHFGIRMVVVRSVLGIRIGVLLGAAAQPLPAAAVMAASMFGLAQLLPAWLPVVRLAVLLPIGALGYLIVLAVTAPALTRTTAQALRRRLPRADGSPPATDEASSAPTTRPLPQITRSGAEG
jgi:lipopolysaccharide exporter